MSRSFGLLIRSFVGRGAGGVGLLVGRARRGVGRFVGGFKGGVGGFIGFDERLVGRAVVGGRLGG